MRFIKCKRVTFQMLLIQNKFKYFLDENLEGFFCEDLVCEVVKKRNKIWKTRKSQHAAVILQGLSGYKQNYQT